MPVLVGVDEMVEFLYEFEESIVTYLYEQWVDTRSKNWKLKSIIDCENRIKGIDVPETPKGAIPYKTESGEVLYIVHSIGDILQFREDYFAGRINNETH